MNIAEVYEKHKHLDQLLSDREWLQCDATAENQTLTREEQDSARYRRIMHGILLDCWQAIKTHAGTVAVLTQRAEQWEAQAIDLAEKLRAPAAPAITSQVTRPIEDHLL